MSPPYVAETGKVPVAVGVMSTEQAAESPAPARMHAPSGVKVTVPVGVVGPVAVSVTVAVQLVAWLTTTVEGLQMTFVEVVCTTDADPSEITLTVLPVPEPRFVTKTSPFPLSYATPSGPKPTGTVATTLFVTSEITLVVLLPKFATKTSPVPLSYATPRGVKPTGMVATTVGSALAVETNEGERRRADVTANSVTRQADKSLCISRSQSAASTNFALKIIVLRLGRTDRERKRKISVE